MNFSLNPKNSTFKSGLVRYFFILISILLISTITARAQERPVKNPARPLPYKTDSVNVQTDTTFNPADTIYSDLDSARVKADSIPRKGDIETTINYSARDSIRASVDGQMIWLYGDAKIDYGEIELEAEEIVIDYANSTIAAQGIRDSLGNRIGYPIFKNGSELYETKGIIYNIKTKRARIKEVVTKQGEAILHSHTAFKNEKNEILSIRNSFTTCNLEHPHFVIRATRTKAIPDDKIVSGPFYLEFNDIPLPAGFLFGMFPAQKESASGIIFPSYGEERRRGFNLRGGGYFFDISDYVKLALMGDIYSKGGHAVNVISNYNKRYKYTGNVNFGYSKNRLGERIEDRNFQNDFRLTWSHSPQSKGTGRFAASVNAATATYNQNNNLMYGTPNEFSAMALSPISTKLSSNVSYNKRFAGTPFSAGINLSHNQDLRTKLVDLPMPNISVNMNNIYPFQGKLKSGSLDNFSIGYTMNATNRITNNLGRIGRDARQDSIAPFTFDNLPVFLDNSRKGVRHTIPVSYSFKMLKHFTVSPTINYEEKWYFERLDWSRAADSTFVADTIPGFNRIANYSFSAGVATRIYGMYHFKRKTSKVKAIRHVINPSVSLGYTPDFTKNSLYYDTLRDKTNQLVYQDKFSNFVYGGSQQGRSGAIGFGIGNNLEMKVRGAKDTVDRKVMLLNNLSVNSSYNLIADSFKLAPLAFAANTNILNNKINVNLSATVDPYNYIPIVNEETQKTTFKRIDSYAWRSGSLGRITNANLAVSTNLNPQKRDQENKTREKVSEAEISENDKAYLLKNAAQYVDFDIPWSLNINYNLNFSNPVNSEKQITQTVQFTGDVSLTEKWKVTFNSGYHFETAEFTQTNLGISRDLHCWQMNLTWVPFGRFQSYNFTIAVKASILQDLKLERRRPFLDNL
ncbi:MAG TPA: putative LPS assembly protein LptD [Chryseosolibacter sp.]